MSDGCEIGVERGVTVHTALTLDFFCGVLFLATLSTPCTVDIKTSGTHTSVLDAQVDQQFIRESGDMLDQGEGNRKRRRSRPQMESDANPVTHKDRSEHIHDRSQLKPTTTYSTIKKSIRCRDMKAMIDRSSMA